MLFTGSYSLEGAGRVYHMYHKIHRKVAFRTERVPVPQLGGKRLIHSVSNICPKSSFWFPVEDKEENNMQMVLLDHEKRHNIGTPDFGARASGLQPIITSFVTDYYDHQFWCIRVFPHTTQQIFNTSWVSYNSTQFSVLTLSTQRQDQIP